MRAELISNLGSQLNFMAWRLTEEVSVPTIRVSFPGTETQKGLDDLRSWTSERAETAPSGAASFVEIEQNSGFLTGLGTRFGMTFIEMESSTARLEAAPFKAASYLNSRQQAI